MTDLGYIYADIDGFYTNFLTCLNDQNDTVTAITTIQNIQVLLYQLDTYVITGIEQKLDSSAGVLGRVFGDKTRQIIEQIAMTSRMEFAKIKDDLTNIRDNFKAISDSGAEVTVESINATVSGEVFTLMIESFAKIETVTTQATEVFGNFAAVTETLENVTASVQTTKAGAAALVGRTEYALDITVQASKKMFSNNTLKLQADMEESFSKFYETAAMQFTGDADVQEARRRVETLVSEINSVFDADGNRFSLITSENFKDFSAHIKSVKEGMTKKTKEVTDYLAEAVADNSGSYSKCLSAEGNNSKNAASLIENLGKNSSLCVAQQINTTMVAQFTATYISQDVVLNFNGTSDRLCSCAVKGDKKVEDKSKRCMLRVS